MSDRPVEMQRFSPWWNERWVWVLDLAQGRAASSLCILASLAWWSLHQPPSQLSVLALIFMTFIKPEGLNSDKALSSVTLFISNKSNVHAYVEKDKNSTLETLHVFRLNYFATSKILDNLIIVLLQNLPDLQNIFFFFYCMRACLSWTQMAWLHLLSGVAVKVQSAKCFSFCAAYLKCWVVMVDTPVCF